MSGERDPAASALVVAAPAWSDGLEVAVARVARVVQRCPPRLAIVEADERARAALRALPGVRAVTDGPLDEETSRDLTQAERLFAAAWAAGRQPRVRAGDGLAWDAPGFDPPDRPRGGGSR